MKQFSLLLCISIMIPHIVKPVFINNNKTVDVTVTIKEMKKSEFKKVQSVTVPAKKSANVPLSNFGRNKEFYAFYLNESDKILRSNQTITIND